MTVEQTVEDKLHAIYKLGREWAKADARSRDYLIPSLSREAYRDKATALDAEAGKLVAEVRDKVAALERERETARGLARDFSQGRNADVAMNTLLRTLLATAPPTEGAKSQGRRRCERCGGPGPVLWDPIGGGYSCQQHHSSPNDRFFDAPAPGAADEDAGGKR